MKLLNRLAKKINYIKSLIKLFPGYLGRLRLFYSTRKFGNNEISIYVYLKEKELFVEPSHGRYLYLFLNFLTTDANKVALLNSFSLFDYHQMGKYGRLLYKLNNLIFARTTPQKTENKILVLDTVSEKLISRNWKKVIHINYNIAELISASSNAFGKESPKRSVVMPYTMHPNRYIFQDVERIECLRQNKRCIRLFFAGNSKNQTHARPRTLEIFNKFGILSRPDIISTIKSNFPNEKDVPTDFLDLQRLIHGGKVFKYLILSSDQFRIPHKNYFDFLSRCDFFVCAPGAFMPLCHNLIESMSIGTIPLINYGECFFPKLKDMETCIKFSDQEDLIQKINIVLDMDQPTIENLRNNVISYYNKFLSPEAFMDRLIGHNESNISLFLPYVKIDSDLSQTETFLEWVSSNK